MFKSKIRISIFVLTSIFISTVSMQAQAWSYGVSWYSEIDFTFSTKGNKLKLANGNFVVSEIYAFDYVSICINVNSGQKTVHSGLGNNGDGVLISSVLEENSDGSGKNKGTFTATGTQSLENMYQHYNLFNEGSGDGSLSCYVDDSPLNAPTGNCTELDRSDSHREHFCHAESDQKVEYKDNLYMPHIAVYVRVVEGDGVAPLVDSNGEYILIAHGIAECEYTGTVTLGEDGFDTTTEPTDCDVTEYPLSVEDPRFDHVLSF